jgi:hypothetical protein
VDRRNLRSAQQYSAFMYESIVINAQKTSFSFV